MSMNWFRPWQVDDDEPLGSDELQQQQSTSTAAKQEQNENVILTQSNYGFYYNYYYNQLLSFYNNCSLFTNHDNDLIANNPTDNLTILPSSSSPSAVEDLAKKNGQRINKERVKKFVCLECKNRFTNRSQLNSHIRTHTGMY